MLSRVQYQWQAAMALYVAVSVVLITNFSATCFGESTISKQLATPIQNFGPSWTASSIGGTTIAIPFVSKHTSNLKHNQKNCTDAVVLIFRTTMPPHKSISNNDERAHCVSTDVKAKPILFGLRIDGPIYKTADAMPLVRSSQRWTFLGTTAICSMTGFAPDVDYLTRYLQKSVDDHRTTLESTTISTTALVSTMKLVDSLAEELQEAGQWQGGRPFGVQVLIVGQESAVGKSFPFGIYTLDPSGGYRRWRGGTAIGYNGKAIRERLFERWMEPTNNDKKNDSNEDGELALFSGLQASVISQSDGSQHLDRSDIYEALLLWQSNEDFCAAQIDPSQIVEMRESISTKLTVADKT